MAVLSIDTGVGEMYRLGIMIVAFLLCGPMVHAGDMERAPVSDGEIEFNVQGEGEPLLLIHGGHVADAFVPLMDQAELEDYKLIQYRRRGYAGSASAEGPPEDYVAQAAADAADLLEHLEIERAHVAGHSSGGVIALQFALDYPERLDSLMLLEPALLEVPSGEKLREELAPAVEHFEADQPAAAVDAFMGVVAGDEWPEGVAEAIPGAVKQARADAQDFFEIEAPGIVHWRFDEEKGQAMDRPVLYLWGSESGAVMGVEEHYREGRDLVKSWFPQTEEHYIEGVNHALQMQDPQAVAEGMAEFLEQNPLPQRNE